MDIFLMKCIEIHIFQKVNWSKNLQLPGAPNSSTFLNVMFKQPGYVTDASETVTKYFVIISIKDMPKTHTCNREWPCKCVYLFFCRYLEN